MQQEIEKINQDRIKIQQINKEIEQIMVRFAKEVEE